MANVVLGGGIGGLSAAYYLSKHAKNGIKLIEASDRVGGWIKTTKTQDGTIFEVGPRTLRVGDLASFNTLRLASDLKLESSVRPVLKSSEAARTRMIYAQNRFCVLPNKFIDFFKVIPPFKLPLFFAVFAKDYFTPKKEAIDDSMYDFAARRLGKDIADYLVSPMMCGIVAGDAKEISVKMLFDGMFKLEQEYGSIAWGLIIKTLLKKKKETTVSDIKSYSSELLFQSQEERWSLWSLEGGLETLPKALNTYLKSETETEICLNTECKKIEFNKDYVVLTLSDGKTHTAQTLYSSLPSRTLAQLLPNEHSFLKEELSAIPYVTVGVVNLAFDGNILPAEAFGYLIPPIEKEAVLGVIFDTCSFPQDGKTVLTVMMGGRWFEDHFGKNPAKETLLEVAMKHLKKSLAVEKKPICSNISILRDCIPQYVVGHYERLEKIENYLTQHKLPLKLIGNSYKGVGVNDVILQSRRAVQSESKGEETG